LSQDPSAGTQVGWGTYVGFVVSRHIERKLVLRASPANISPREAVTLTAELDPPFPGAEYQFSFGAGTPAAWSPDAQAQFTYLNDGDYEAVAAARWNNGSVSSNPVRIVVHSIKYEVRLLPDSLHLKSGETVSFLAEVNPTVETATYIYHFGDGIPDQASSLPTAQHVYHPIGNYSARVTVRIANTLVAGGAAHSHDFASPPVQLSVEPPPPPPPIMLYVIGAAFLIAVVVYGVQKVKSRGPKARRLQILVHKDLGTQSVEAASGMPKGTDLEIHVVRSWGEQNIKSEGPLWARIETINE
jgi:PKD domain